MAVADEMAWEPRLPWIHPHTPVIRALGRPTAQPVPERFNIVVVDILAGLTFDPVLGPNPRRAALARRPSLTSIVFDPVSVIYPVVWEPILPTGTRRGRLFVRRRPNQSSVEPAPQGVIAAQRMTWMPHLPARTNRRINRRRGPLENRLLEFSVLATGIMCVEIVNDTLTSPSLIDDTLTSPSLITQSLTSPTIIHEEFC